ncbi:MAG TPA: UDP-N-acetylglucosamine 1-carboxyvinyltransferase [Planctomycetaceae bacterium]|jgi:UDP-N-acetylglucosamine 1-carboxyvinyltransferase|nr:UDP-N-acetylglucosamine 1-carboxyvinyltransferase [Planctomycetaceae bacterium]
MEMFVIQGGIPLAGTVAVSGAKNSALPLMAAALAAEGQTVLRGVPRLVDVETLSLLLQTLGVQVRRDDQDGLTLEVVDERPHVADYELVRRMRAGFCVLGPLLARRGRACVSLPGGCNIGDRPIELHLKGLRALGAEIAIERGYVVAQAARLRGAHIDLRGPFGSTVTGTCNVMVAAALADGQSTIEAAACEPEVVDLGNLLNAMGARINGLGTPVLRIEGVRKLTAAEHTVIPDRIEAATLMIATAITRGQVTLTGVRTDQLTNVLEKLRQIGVSIDAGGDVVTVNGNRPLRPVDCVALPYPGLPTDLQAQLTALLATIPGVSIVTDKIFPDRFMHAPELVRMGARIRRERNSAVLDGVERLSGACVMACDLRASAALVLAGLAASGTTVIRRIYHLDRGYERLESKLSRLGANILRTTDEPANFPESLRLSAERAEPIHTFELPESANGPKWFQQLRSDRLKNHRNS